MSQPKNPKRISLLTAKAYEHRATAEIRKKRHHSEHVSRQEERFLIDQAHLSLGALKRQSWLLLTKCLCYESYRFSHPINSSDSCSSSRMDKSSRYMAL